MGSLESGSAFRDVPNWGKVAGHFHLCADPSLHAVAFGEETSTWAEQLSVFGRQRAEQELSCGLSAVGAPCRWGNKRGIWVHHRLVPPTPASSTAHTSVPESTCFTWVHSSGKNSRILVYLFSCLEGQSSAVHGLSPLLIAADSPWAGSSAGLAAARGSVTRALTRSLCSPSLPLAAPFINLPSTWGKEMSKDTALDHRVLNTVFSTFTVSQKLCLLRRKRVNYCCQYSDFLWPASLFEGGTTSPQVASME